MNTISKPQSKSLELFSPAQLQSLKSSDPVPLYHKLHQLLRQIIYSGNVAHGSQLPTEKQLQESTGMSRVTIKRALDELALEGLVVRHRGIGTTVSYTPPPMNAVRAPLIAMLENLEQMGRNTEVAVLYIKREPCSADIARQFDMPNAKPLLHIIRRRNLSRGGPPFGYYESWTQGENVPISARAFKSKPRLQLFREAGLVFSHIRQSLTAVAAESHIATELNVPIGSPLLHLMRSSYDKNQNLVDYLMAYYSPKLYQYQMELNLNDSSQ